MINFIFFGRTTYDKGIDIILDTFSRFAEEEISGWNLHIYGTGPYDAACKKLAQAHNTIHYHGRANQDIIHAQLQNTDYCLAPSRVLETFGKSALESLAQGVSVIGFQKGGLAQFINNEYAINQATPQESLYTMCKKLIIDQTTPDRQKAKDIADHYSTASWTKTIAQTLGTDKTILHVSDFISKIGGIETFLRESKTLLEHNNYTVHMFGSNNKVSARNLLITACNFPAWFRLHNTLNKTNPDIIRFHSWLRFLGPIVLYGLPAKSMKVATIHDLGYFHPYPSKLYNISDIPSFSLGGFLAHSSGIKSKILIMLKFLSLSILQHKLKKTIDIWFVPSPFLVDILHTSRHIPKEKIIVLPHFIG